MRQSRDRFLVVTMPKHGEPIPHSYYVSRAKAEVMLARGHARLADNGTRTIVLCHVRPRGMHNRIWRIVVNRSDKYGVPLFSSYQWVEPAPNRVG